MTTPDNPPPAPAAMAAAGAATGTATGTAGGTASGTAPSAVPFARHLPATRVQTHVLGGGLVFLALLLAYLFLSVWPGNFTTDTAGGTDATFTLLATSCAVHVTADVRLLLLVMVCGALGSYLHTATSFADFVGNERLGRSWMWWYVLKPFVGMVLAVVLYLVVRAGFLSGATEAGKLNLYGIAGLAAMAGMFSKQATDKLGEVFSTLFQTARGNGDEKRQGDLANPVPVLTGATPPRLAVTAGPATLQLQGEHFAPGVAARVDGHVRPVEVLGETALRLDLLPGDAGQPGTLKVWVVNPAPGGGESAPLSIPVEAAGGAA